MSVYTLVTPQQLKQFLDDFEVGELKQFAGISDGIENTNYFVTTSSGEYVLTLFEILGAEELPYFLELMAFLAEHEIPSAHPVAGRDGRYLRRLNGKPAALVQRLQGASVEMPTMEQCQAIGEQMGRMHVACQEFSLYRAPDRGPDWREQTARQVMPMLTEDEQRLLAAELKYQARVALDDLPAGVIHADLFRDNALFVGNRLTGIIDFYYACNFYLIYDLAVSINDWCTRGDKARDDENAKALLASYCRHRSVTAREIEAWPAMLRAAALRFWLSRLKDRYFPREGEITHIKNPGVFMQTLISRVDAEDDLRAMWPDEIRAASRSG